jgi:2-polyprenyl-3-methyl-5-hydroxy-6-metoxy-1,4-benzoquinol methylase
VNISEGYTKYLRSYEEELDQLKSSQYWEDVRNYIIRYLHSPPTIEELWGILDRVWEDMKVHGGNHRSLIDYYSHPIWLYNGLMMEVDEVCVRKRYEIVSLAKKFHPQSILDMGGGTGALLKMAHQELPTAQRLDLVDISTKLKGHVSEILRPFGRIRVLDRSAPPYDIVFSTEVMEHLPNPFEALSTISHSLKRGGVLIGTWSFYPMIKAHLPANLCLARFFHRFIPLFGFRFLEMVKNGSIIFIFEKIKDLGPVHLKTLENILIFGRPLFRLLSHCIP